MKNPSLFLLVLSGHDDTSFHKGYIGLWTKADSVTEFDNLTISWTP